MTAGEIKRDWQNQECPFTTRTGPNSWTMIVRFRFFSWKARLQTIYAAIFGLNMTINGQVTEKWVETE